MSIRRPVPVCLAFALPALLLSGCSPRDPFPELHPVSGTVTRDGKPVTNGGLIFLPQPGEGSGLVVNASVHRDGTFALSTERTDAAGTTVRPGAPAGRYTVVYHPHSDGSKTDLAVTLEQQLTVEPGGGRVSLVLPATPSAANQPKDRP